MSNDKFIPRLSSKTLPITIRVRDRSLTINRSELNVPEFGEYSYIRTIILDGIEYTLAQTLSDGLGRPYSWEYWPASFRRSSLIITNK